MKRKRYKPEIRKESLIAAALDLAEQSHYAQLTRDEIAKAAGVASATLQYHFKTMAQFRGDLMRAAVKQERLAVVAQGLTSGDLRAAKAPEALRRAALEKYLL